MRRRFFLILNPGAGIAGVPLVRNVIELLQAAGATISTATPGDPAAARAATREAAIGGTFDAILAAGGDGTIRQSAAALVDCDVPLGVIPVGTGNVLAHEIGLARTPQAVCRMLLEGPVVRVACARANGEPFLLMAGIGFDGRVVGALDQRLKSRIGKAAYMAPVLGALVRPVDRLALSIDGRTHVASWAVISNARHYGGRFVMAPRAGIRERGLEAVLFKANHAGVLAGQLLSLVTGRLDTRSKSGSDIEMVRCAHVVVTTHHPVPAQIDGDAFGSTPIEIAAGDEEVNLIVPS
jgi:diacylglycerol kinase (ATP)